MSLLDNVVQMLMVSGKLPATYRPHKLSGNWRGYWECHLAPDWLLLWIQDKDRFILTLTDTGTHSDLFKK